MVKLSNEVLSATPSSLNTIGERVLNLRGLRINTIESLSITEDRNDCIDLTDNDVARLENFPVMKRLSTILISKNQISKIEPSLAQQIPNVKVIILSQNKIEKFKDLEPLFEFKKLEVLCLWENPVTLIKNYRLYMINKCPSIKLLDFKKVKEKVSRD